jgi:hypothetical protein
VYPANGTQTFDNPCKHIFVRGALLVVRRTRHLVVEPVGVPLFMQNNQLQYNYYNAIYN